MTPPTAEQLDAMAAAHLREGRAAQAEPLARLAVAADPRRAAFHTTLGLVLGARGRGDAAVAALARAAALDPASADGHVHHGDALIAAGRPCEAVESFRRAIALRPDAAAWDHLAAAHRAAGQLVDAVAAYRRAIDLEEPVAQRHADLGHTLRAAGALDGAIAAHRRAAELMPEVPVPLDNLGSALQKAGRPAEAMTAFVAALAIEPERPQTWNHLGTVHCDAGRWADAAAAFGRALASRPDFADAVNNLGTVLEEQGHRPEAMAHYRRAAALAPAASSAPWNMALMHLLVGDYAAGWPAYEHRWRQPLNRSVHRGFPQPMWDGSPLAGRTILLHAEQGLGDAIHFARYAPLVAARGGTVVVECHPPLTRLFASLAGVRQVVGRGVGELPAFDVHCPLMSLPMLFGTALDTVPADVPYLHPEDADVAAWRTRLGVEPPAKRVGVVWAGAANHQKDRDRSLPGAAFAPLAAAPGVRLYSLQVGKVPPAGVPIVDWTAELHDFADTAALASQLDLVVTADTSVAHLAGAMGKPTWVLVPFAPDWRWLLDRDDSPWYPTARLFRQTTAGDWAGPIGKVTEALRSDRGVNRES